MTPTIRHGAAVTLAALVVTLGPSGAGAHAFPPPALCVPDAPCKLSGTMPEDGEVLGVFIAADGQRAVYLADQETDGLLELYSVPVGGGELPRKLNVPVPETDIFGVQISADSTRVLYLARTEPGGPGDPGPAALFSVPIAGPASASVRLANDIPGASANHPAYKVSPDSAKVVFAVPARDRLKVVPIDGPAGVGRRLTAPFVTGGSVAEFEITADSKSVVYRASQDTAARELFRVPLLLAPAPDPPTAKLNGPLVAGGGVQEFVLAAGNGPVVYRADQDTDQVFELYSVRPGGNGRAKLNSPLPPGWVVTPPVDESPKAPARITPDGSRVVYETLFSQGGVVLSELHSVAIAGPATTSVRLDKDVDSANLRPYQYQVSADGAWVVYQAVDDDGGTHWLFSVPAIGPASAGTLMTFPTPVQTIFSISPDSTRVVHRFDFGSANVPLFSTPIDDPPATVRINGQEDPSGTLLIDDASTRVVYRDGGTGDLFSASIDASGDRYNLTASLTDPLISRTRLADGGRLVVYAVQQGLDGPRELYSSPLAPQLLPPTQG